MKKIPFIKMHGLGNDFVIIEGSLLASIKDIKDFVIKISDRRVGVGCDQFITYTKQNDSVLMKIFNQDGSSAKVCGNASRCLSRLIFDKYGIRNISIKIDDKVIAAFYTDSDNIAVNMGRANFAADWMPKNEDLWQLAEKYTIEPKEMICVDIGNPHLIIFSKLSDKDKKIIGKNLQKHPFFTNGVNVNFAKIENDTDEEKSIISLKVWERGAGFTMACGSGASATYAAASKLGFAGEVGIVQFEMGSLKMNKSNDEILMTGPAAYIFTGEYYYNE